MNHLLPCWGLALTALGCAGAPPAPAEAPSTGYACHLNCSGAESTFRGATEAEARAAATDRVKDQCRPEDGQYFLVCEPAK